VGLGLEQNDLKDRILELFDSLLFALQKSKEFKEEDIPTRLIFDIYKMWKSSSSRIFSESALLVDPDLADTLLEKGLLQKIASDEGEKYALTFRGIAECIKMKYSVSFEEQFMRFLEFADQDYNTEAQGPLTWREKLATLSLILLASTSDSAAIRLNNDNNKAVLLEVLQKTLSCLKKTNAIGSKESLTTVKRGENPASALMCRIDTLARKTRQYYRSTGHSEYFLDIEKDGDIDETRLHFLLGKVFERYDPQYNYRELYSELIGISQLYYPRFLGRAVNTTIVLSILRKLRDFFEDGILRLPHLVDTPQKSQDPNTGKEVGKFWPIVRQRMKEKATQLYMKEHPGASKVPPLRILSKKGYLRTAKIAVLREMQCEGSLLFKD
jgi:hypothetical protein